MDNGQPAPKPAGNDKKRRRALALLTLLFLAAGLSYGAYWSFYARFRETTDDAYVGGNLIPVMPQVPGTVVAVNADDTDRVSAGQVLVQLDDSDARIALEQAQADLADAVRRVRQMFEAVRQYRANLALKRTSLEQAQQDWTRRQGLAGGRALSREEAEHARIAVEAASSQLALAAAQLAGAEAQIAHTTLAHHPLVKQAEAKLRQAYLALERTRIYSPVTGYVAKRTVQVGQKVAPGTPLMAVVPLEDLWVDVNLKEDQLQRVRIGQPVILRSDAYGGGVVYHGKVVGLAPGTGSVFSVLPPQNATGNWIKIVQRLPVRVSLDPRELKAHPLRLGLSMVATIDTHDTRGPVLAPIPVSGPRYATDVYAAAQAGVERLIRRIIAENSGIPGKSAR